MTRITDGVVHTVKLSRVRHDVEGEVERASPNVVDLDVAELGINVDHAATQDLCALAHGPVSLRKECGAPAKQHAAIWREAVVVEIVFRIIDHAIARAEFAGQRLGKN